MVTSQSLQKMSPRLIRKRSNPNKETVNIPLRGLMSPMKRYFLHSSHLGTLRVPKSAPMQKYDTICKNCPMYQKMYSRTKEHEVFLGATNAILIPLRPAHG